MEAKMDGLLAFLEFVQKHRQARDNFLGLLHVLIGRRIQAADGQVVSEGQTWRQTAALLKKVRWDKAAADQLGLDCKLLPPRDRERFWYAVISAAHVDSAPARAAGDRLAAQAKAAGYQIGMGP
jgi:hypothetical protein